jgi:hypothetical protein
LHYIFGGAANGDFLQNRILILRHSPQTGPILSKMGQTHLVHLND